MDILELLEKAKKSNDEPHELLSNLSSLVQSIGDLINNTDRIAVQATDLGMVISLNVLGENKISACFGVKKGIEKAVENITKVVKEQVK